MMPSRAQLLELLQGLHVPRNYRWVLDNEDGLLVLTIQNKTPFEVRAWGRRLFYMEGPWHSLRELKAPTYHSMLEQVKWWPEFLEFRVIGETTTRTVTGTSYAQVLP